MVVRFFAGRAAALAGCADNPMVLKGKVTQYEQQQQAMSRQYSELQNRATALDKDNQELGQLLGPVPAAIEGV